MTGSYPGLFAVRVYVYRAGQLDADGRSLDEAQPHIPVELQTLLNELEPTQSLSADTQKDTHSQTHTERHTGHNAASSKNPSTIKAAGLSGFLKLHRLWAQPV